MGSDDNTLGQAGGPGPVPDLQARLRQLERFEEMGNFPALLKALDDPEPSVRKKAAGLLARSPRAVEATERLCRALHDPSDEVRRVAAEILGSVGDERAIGPLLAALSESDWPLRMYALKSLARFQAPGIVGPVVQLLERDRDNAILREGLRVLSAQCDPDAYALFVEALNDPDWTIRWIAAEALGKLGDKRAIEPLLKLQGDNEERVRWSVRIALEKLRDISRLELLVVALGDEEPFVRMASAEELGKLGHPMALEPLLVSAHDRDPDVRKEVVIALGNLAEPGSYDALLELMTDASAEIRCVATDALGKLGNPEALPALFAAMDDQADQVRWAAMWAVGKFKDVRAVEPLIRRLEDPSDFLRREACRLLRELTGESPGDDAESWKAWYETFKLSVQELAQMKG